MDILRPGSTSRRTSARTCIDVFDYADASTQWVTDHQIAQQLATTINSLADQSKAAGGPGKVIVVAHSMGGLATRCASAASCSGVTGAAAHIAALITFGTPTLGSFLKGYGASEAEHLVADILSTDCYATGNRCLARWPVSAPRSAPLARLLPVPHLRQVRHSRRR